MRFSAFTTSSNFMLPVLARILLSSIAAGLGAAARPADEDAAARPADEDADGSIDEICKRPDPYRHKQVRLSDFKKVELAKE